MSAIRTFFAEFSDFTTSENFLRVGLYILGIVALTVVATIAYVKRYGYQSNHRVTRGKHGGRRVSPEIMRHFRGPAHWKHAAA